MCDPVQVLLLWRIVTKMVKKCLLDWSVHAETHHTWTKLSKMLEGVTETERQSTKKGTSTNQETNGVKKGKKTTTKNTQEK